MAEWFAPKQYGLGSGFPITWQGWVATFFYVGVMIGAGYLFGERSLWAFGSIAVTATVIFMAVAAKTTRGGWRWRWGGKE